MDRLKAFYRLQFDDHQAPDNKVETITTFETNALILQRQRVLPDEVDPTKFEFVAKTLLVNGLEQPRPQATMNLDRRADNLIRSPNPLGP